METVAQGLPPEPPSGQRSASAVGAPTGAWGGDGFSFGDLVDIVNPLQHIPVVSWAYRAITGDQIAPAAKLAGGGLFGGLPGLALGVADSLVTEATGKNPGELAVAWLGGNAAPDPGIEAPQTQFAAAAEPPVPTTAGAAAVVSPSADALLMAAFGGGGTAVPAMLPGAVALPRDQAALLLASLGIPETAHDRDWETAHERGGAEGQPRAQANPESQPAPRSTETVALPGTEQARLHFLTAAAAAGNDIGAMFGVR